MTIELDIPQIFTRHVFACATQRPPNHPRGSCVAAGVQPLWECLGKKLEAAQLTDTGFTMSGCLGFCKAGPLLVVYPDGIWYGPATPEDIDEIVDSHLVKGEIVERLVMILTRN